MTEATSLYHKLSRGGGKPPSAPTTVGSERIELLNALPSKMYNLRGVDVACYSIGTLSKVLGKSQVTIRSWEQKGWMPLPKVRTAPPVAPTIQGKAVKGRRLYTRQQVEYLVNAYETCYLDDPKRADWNKFRSLLQSYPSV